MRISRVTGAAAVMIALLPLMATPAWADTAGYTGIIKDADGDPVPGACLDAYSDETVVARTFCTGTDGRYTISGLPGAEYRVRVRAEGYRAEWWHRAPDHLNAAAVWLPGPGQERDVVLGKGAGSIAGTVVDPAGKPTDATVRVYAVEGGWEAFAYTWTDGGQGTYRFDNVPPGQYQISVFDNNRGTQWLPGKESRDDAAVYTVTDGGTLVADETWLPLGAVRLRVTDGRTGVPVPAPCIYVRSTPNGRQGCGKDGVVQVDEVPPGRWGYTVSAGAGYFAIEEGLHVDVERGTVAEATATLRPGAAAATTVVDAATGQPAEDICVRLIEPGRPSQMTVGSDACADEDGKLEIGPFEEGRTVQLYAFQASSAWRPPTKRYGAQWVTAKGGSGDQREALPVTFRPHETVVVPTIRMDPPGSIGGTVRDVATGATVPGVCAYPFAMYPTRAATGKNCSGADGRYTVDGLGPYRWPVQFTPWAVSGYAWQWSGDAADRWQAAYIPVSAGGTATADAKLVKGGTLTGTVTIDGKPVRSGYVWTYNLKTGDITSPSYTNVQNDGTFTLKGHRTQDVFVQYHAEEKTCWYGKPDSTGRPIATPIRVTAGQDTPVTLDMAATCAADPSGPRGVRDAANGASPVGRR